MTTQSVLSPPLPPVHVAAGFDDDIRDLGDRIARLTPSEAEDLQRYLTEEYGIGRSKPAG